MSEPKATCVDCGRTILQRTADGFQVWLPRTGRACYADGLASPNPNTR